MIYMGIKSRSSAVPNSGILYNIFPPLATHGTGCRDARRKSLFMPALTGYLYN